MKVSAETVSEDKAVKFVTARQVLMFHYCLTKEYANQSARSIFCEVHKGRLTKLLKTINSWQFRWLNVLSSLHFDKIL